MNKSTILIVDDQKTIHIVLKALLQDDYELEFASDAQEAIDIMSDKPINLLLLDIEMPELSGLEFLESLMIDTVLKNVPVIIITGEATEEREQRATQLGAAGFVEKKEVVSDTGKEDLLELINKNLKGAISKDADEKDYKTISKSIIKGLVEDARKDDFFYAARKLGVKLMKHFQIEYVSFWAIQGGTPNMLLSLGDTQPEDFGPDQIKSENAFKEISINKSPYLTNNAASQNKGIFANVAMNSGLSSEIGVPFFKITRQMLVNNKMRVPKSTPLYGFIVLKRNRVFTTKEYKVLTTTLGYCGSILWGLYQKLFAK